jgi:hypothetical protein
MQAEIVHSSTLVRPASRLRRDRLRYVRLPTNHTVRAHCPDRIIEIALRTQESESITVFKRRVVSMACVTAVSELDEARFEIDEFHPQTSIVPS